MILSLRKNRFDFLIATWIIQIYRRRKGEINRMLQQTNIKLSNVSIFLKKLINIRGKKRYKD